MIFVRVPLATGERMFTVTAFRDLLEKRCVDILQPDLLHGEAGLHYHAVLSPSVNTETEDCTDTDTLAAGLCVVTLIGTLCLASPVRLVTAASTRSSPRLSA